MGNQRFRAVGGNLHLWPRAEIAVRKLEKLPTQLPWWVITVTLCSPQKPIVLLAISSAAKWKDFHTCEGPFWGKVNKTPQFRSEKANGK